MVSEASGPRPRPTAGHPPVDPEALLDAAVLEDPHPFLRALRERDAVHPVGRTGVHLVTRWSTIEEALGREDDFSAHLTGALIRDGEGRPGVFEIPATGATEVIATADEPDHGVHRALLQPSLVPEEVARLEPTLRIWAAEAIDPVVANGGGDLVRSVAEPVPARSILALLGLPAADLERVRPWAMMGGDMLAGALDQDDMLRLGRETTRMSEYLTRHLAETLATAEDARRGPLARALATGVEHGRIPLEVAVGISIVLFGAGGESTASLIGSAARLLAEDAALFARLRDDPGLVPRFVEEVVRLESPFKGHYRAVRRACRLAGHGLAPGDRLFLLWSSANRDAAIFERPDLLDLDRRHPKQHMGFGRGGHFCIGAPLARLEARVVLEELLARAPGLELAPGTTPRHVPSLFVRRLERLDVTISP